MVLSSLLLFGISATVHPVYKFKNLQVLPQDISEKQLDSIMDYYTVALKINCDFCHKAPQNLLTLTPANKNEIDFALDNPMKENARKMMRMTIDINHKYFNTDPVIKPEDIKQVTCNTCHRGNSYPAYE